MQNFTFFLKNINGNSNKAADSLSRRCLVLHKFKLKAFIFEHMKDMYEEDP